MSTYRVVWTGADEARLRKNWPTLEEARACLFGLRRAGAQKARILELVEGEKPKPVDLRALVAEEQAEPETTGE